MDRNVYSIRDVKAAEYLGLVVFRSDLEAQRFFLLTITDQRGSMWKFPKDYMLYNVGGFDNETGLLERAPVPRDVTPHSLVDTYVERFINGASKVKQGEAGSGAAGGGVSASGGASVPNE